MSNLTLARIALAVGTTSVSVVVLRIATDGREAFTLFNLWGLLLGAGCILCYFLKPSE